MIQKVELDFVFMGDNYLLSQTVKPDSRRKDLRNMFTRLLDFFCGESSLNCQVIVGEVKIQDYEFELGPYILSHFCTPSEFVERVGRDIIVHALLPYMMVSSDEDCSVSLFIL